MDCTDGLCIAILIMLVLVILMWWLRRDGFRADPEKIKAAEPLLNQSNTFQAWMGN